MALGRCRECGKEVSTDAKTCPNCGKSKPVPGAVTRGLNAGWAWFRRQSRTTQVVIVAVLLLLALVGNTQESRERSSGRAGGTRPRTFECALDIGLAHENRHHLIFSLGRGEQPFNERFLDVWPASTSTLIVKSMSMRQVPKSELPAGEGRDSFGRPLPGTTDLIEVEVAAGRGALGLALREGPFTLIHRSGGEWWFNGQRYGGPCDEK